MEPAPNEWVAGRTGAGIPPLDEISGSSGAPTDHMPTLEEAFPGIDFTEAQAFRPRKRAPAKKPKGRTVQVTGKFMAGTDKPLKYGGLRMTVYEGDDGRRIWSSGGKSRAFTDAFVDVNKPPRNKIATPKLKGISSDVVTVELEVKPNLVDQDLIGKNETFGTKRVFELRSDGDLTVVATVPKERDPST